MCISVCVYVCLLTLNPVGHQSTNWMVLLVLMCVCVCMCVCECMFTNLESSRTPVHKLNGSFGLDGSDGGVHVFRDDVTTVQHTAGHVLAVTRITLHHLVGRLEAGVGDLCHRQLLVVRLLSRDDWGVGSQGEVDTGVGHQVGLELCQIYVESTIEAEGGCDGGHNLTNQTVQVGVGGTFDVQVTTTDVVDGLVVDHEGTVRVLQGGVGRQDGIVGLDHGGGHL